MTAGRLTHCRNCHAELRGEYCFACGQREGRPDIQFSEVAGELSGDLFRWDSRLWQTLVPLLFRPGYLTREFIEGRKARYVPPFRLYLIISFVMFLTLSLGNLENPLEPPPEPVDELEQVEAPEPQASAASPATEAQSGETAVPEEAKPVVPDASPSGAEGDTELRLDMDIRLNPFTQEELEALPEDEVVFAPIVIGDDGEGVEGKFSIGLSSEDSPAWLRALDARLEQNAERVARDPSNFTQQLLEYLPQMMFLLLPLFALLLRLAYLFSPFHYLQHLVFALHFHSFLYLMILLSELAERVMPWHVDTFLFLWLLLYLPLGLRRAYGSGIGGAIGKSLWMVFAHGLLTIFGFATISLLALLMS